MKTKINQARIDKLSISFDTKINLDSNLPSPVFTDEGFLLFKGRPTRAGIFEYYDSNGLVRRELRPPEEVGNPSSYMTLAMKPISIEHSGHILSSKTVTDHVVGSTSADIKYENEHIINGGVIWSKAAIDAVMTQKKAELSAGYLCDLEMRSGIWTDESGMEHKFDAIQRNIRYNHLSIVSSGRGGPSVKIKTDHQKNQTEKKTMKKELTINGNTFSTEEVNPIQREIGALEKSRTDAVSESESKTKELAKLKADFDAQTVLYDAQTAKVDALESKITGLEDSSISEEKAIELAEEKLFLQKIASEFGIKTDGLSSKSLKREVVKTARKLEEGDPKLDSEGYLDAAFGFVIEAQESKSPTQKEGAFFSKNKEDAKLDSESEEDEGFDYINASRKSQASFVNGE